MASISSSGGAVLSRNPPTPAARAWRRWPGLPFPVSMQHAASGQPLAKYGRGGQAVHDGHVDVEHRDVRPMFQRRREDLVAGADRGDHGEIRLQLRAVRRARPGPRADLRRGEP